MPDVFDFREISEQLSHIYSVRFYDDTVGNIPYISNLFRRIDDHLKECKFFNGLSILRSKEFSRRTYRSSDNRSMDRYRNGIILLRCSCGWETPVEPEAYNMCYCGLDLEDIIADANYKMLSQKLPRRFEDEVKKILESHVQFEKENIRVIRKKAESRFLKPLEGLEV